ncbi:MAG: cryptochrome/photolyase family protein [Acidimicrobiales bacterium mtb01]|nr:cryptochrome/photolyase family protein [Actinomycetota bacterium]TEX46749.1 MAG: cryptochrome/photolyase family protein [Acidimicrobiales bacterium mtb01]
MKTVWVLGDQLNRRIGALAEAAPSTHRVLFVESRAKLASKAWHIQRAHFVITSMRRFADELRAEGFDVDYRFADSLADGHRQHVDEYAPTEVDATEPLSWAGRALMHRLGCSMVRSNQFLCHYDDFAAWMKTRKSFKMEDFYRWQRQRLGYLMDGDDPVGGQWNYDADNREPPPKDGSSPWPAPLLDELDDLDREVIADISAHCHGEAPAGVWATSRTAALRRLDHFVNDVLPMFGPHEDAMTTRSWHLAHSLLSPYLNIGLLLPGEVCDAVQRAFDAGRVPVASAEGFIRQVIGWREYVWGLYWAWMPEYAGVNELDASEPLPPVFTGRADTKMNCLAHALGDVNARAYAHHIQRLMVIGNLSLIAGIDPRALTDWMWANFVDGAEWVMVPNVMGMSQFADGGRMATKPYASGGAYIDRMSDYCKGCAYDRTKRVGDDACPFTTLYWDFMARHETRFGRNPRVAQQVRAAFKLKDLDEVRERAAEVKVMLREGRL